MVMGIPGFNEESSMRPKSSKKCGQKWKLCESFLLSRRNRRMKTESAMTVTLTADAEKEIR